MYSQTHCQTHSLANQCYKRKTALFRPTQLEVATKESPSKKMKFASVMIDSSDTFVRDACAFRPMDASDVPHWKVILKWP